MLIGLGRGFIPGRGRGPIPGRGLGPIPEPAGLGLGLGLQSQSLAKLLTSQKDPLFIQGFLINRLNTQVLLSFLSNMDLCVADVDVLIV